MGENFIPLNNNLFDRHKIRNDLFNSSQRDI